MSFAAVALSTGNTYSKERLSRLYSLLQSCFLYALRQVPCTGSTRDVSVYGRLEGEET